MKTETEIENLKLRFVEWLDDDQCVCCTEDDVVRTSETAQNFIDACREYESVAIEKMDGMMVTVIERSQRCKGEPCTDLYILNADEHIRLVVTF